MSEEEKPLIPPDAYRSPGETSDKEPPLSEELVKLQVERHFRELFAEIKKIDDAFTKQRYLEIILEWTKDINMDRIYDYDMSRYDF